VQAFATNPDVAFGDVNLAEDQVRETPVGGDHNPGAGGWPTVKYFNKETGYQGKPYKQKTGDAMCDELGNDMYMQAHIEEAGATQLCRLSDGAGCSEKELKFIEEWKGTAPPTSTRRSTASAAWQPRVCGRSSRAGFCSASPSSSRSRPVWPARQSSRRALGEL
jgi:hypothetical protein